jgi:hypothetical protein
MICQYDLDCASDLILGMDSEDLWNEWEQALNNAYFKEFSSDQLSLIITSHKDSLDNGGNHNLSKEEIAKVKYKPSIVVYDGTIYKALDGQHRINLAKKEFRDHTIYIVLISKELMYKLI